MDVWYQKQLALPANVVINGDTGTDLQGLSLPLYCSESKERGFLEIKVPAIPQQQKQITSDYLKNKCEGQ